MPVINMVYLNKLYITETLHIYTEYLEQSEFKKKISYEEQNSKLTTLQNTEGKFMF